MKQFDFITEADARALEPGTSVTLTAGGQITPLAQDTLRARHITVLGNSVDEDLALLAPVADIRRIAIGSDHSGVAMKNVLRDELRTRGLAVNDIGTHGSDPVDYPDIAAQVARLVA